MQRREDRLTHLPCPVGGNVQEFLQQQTEARQIFQFLCPPGALVAEVRALRCTGGIKCGYEVTYRCGVAGGALIHEIMTSKPNNSEIARTTQLFLADGIPSVQITYKVICLCPRVRRGKFENWNIFIKGEIDSVEEIKINLDNLNVEEKVFE